VKLGGYATLNLYSVSLYLGHDDVGPGDDTGAGAVVAGGQGFALGEGLGWGLRLGLGEGLGWGLRLGLGEMSALGLVNGAEDLVGAAGELIAVPGAVPHAAKTSTTHTTPTRIVNATVARPLRPQPESALAPNAPIA
jgi:hypothetical protein